MTLSPLLAPLLALLASGAVLAATPADKPPTTQHRDAVNLVDTWLEAQVAYHRVPSLAAGIVVGQELVWHKGYGFVDAARTRPADADTLYSICSISKLFTSIAVMQLWEQGKLGLDDDIGRWVPAAKALKQSDADSGPITIRMLLMHAAGVPRETLQESWSYPDYQVPSREAILADLARQQTFMRTGDHFQYSNLGMFLLGEAVASASGQPYRDYVQQQVLSPLKLADTRPYLPLELLEQRLPPGYSALNRQGQRERLKPFDMTPLAAAAGYTSSVNDLARLASWNFKLRKDGGQNVLKVATLREMQRVQWQDPDGGDTWGLGYWVGRSGGDQLVGHSGRCPGYVTSMTLVPAKELGVIALTNTYGDGPYGRQIRTLMLKGMALPVAPTDAQAPRLADYSGHYQAHPGGGEAVVQPWGKDLVMLWLPTDDPVEDMEVIRHQGGDVFREVRKDDTLGAEIRFERDASGKVIASRSWNYVSKKLD
ncbi:MAG: serine hydrolase [Proteobacteria bacterium]|nr:serine hydrolase [Pseudomonadota bacterium]